MEKIEQSQSRYFDFVVELLILIVVFLVPTVYDRRIGIVFSGTKLPTIRILMLLILSVWSCKILIFREHKFVRSLLDWPVASYMLAVTVATITSVNFLVSFMGFYGRFEGLSTWYVYGLLYFVTLNFIKTKEQFRRVFMAVISAATLMSIYGIIQRFFWDPYAWGGVITWQRVIATIGQPNFLAAYVIMAFFMGLSLLIMDHEKEEAPKPPETQKRKGARQRAEFKAANPDVFFQLLIVLCFAGFLSAYLIMIYFIDTNYFPLLVLSWALITFLAVLFVFISKDAHPLVLDGIILVSLPLIYTCIFFTQSRGGLMAFFASGALFAILADRNNLLKHWKELGILALMLFLITAATITNPQYSPFKRFTEEVKVEETGQSQTNASQDKAGSLQLEGAAGSRIETWNSAFRIIADHPFSGIGPEVMKMVFPRYETELFRFKEAFHVKQDRCHDEVFDIAVTKGIPALFIYVWLLFAFFRLGLQKIYGNYDKNIKLFVAGMLSAFVSYQIQNLFSFGVLAITSLVWVVFGLVSVPEIRDDKETELPPFKGISLPEIPPIGVATVAVIFVFLSYFSTLQFRADRYFKAGKTDVDQQNFPKALAEFKDSLDILPFEGGTLTYYGITYLNVAQASPDKPALMNDAIQALLRASQLDPYNADNFYILGKTYLAFANTRGAEALEKSLQYSNNSIAIDPYYAEAYFNRGLVYEMRGQFPLAAEEYKKAFMINPSLTDSMKRLGLVYSNMGQPQKIIETFNEALERYKGNVGLLENLGIAYTIMKRDDRVVEVNEQILKVDPKNSRAFVNLGLAHMRMGRLLAAEDSFNQLLIYDPQNIDGYSNLGTIYYRTGRRSGAVEKFNQVLILDPNNEAAKNMLKILGAPAR